MLDRFLASRPDLTAADREMLRGWRHPVEGIFEIRGKDRDAIVLLNLFDDLDYRTYSNVGPAAFRRLPKGGFVHAPCAHPPAEAEERLNAYYRHRQEAALAASPGRRRLRNVPAVDIPAFKLPAELTDADTVGIIYDETDGLNFYNEYGMLRDLFADPALATDKRHAQVLRGYLGADSIGPLPLRRLAAAFPQNADTVFRKILHKPSFTWAEHGEALLRRRKPWYYEREPRPGTSVIGARLSELANRR